MRDSGPGTVEASASADAGQDTGEEPVVDAALADNLAAPDGPSPPKKITYVPFTFLDPKIASRPDVAGKSAKLTRVLETPPLSQITVGTHKDVEVSLFSEVHAYFEAVASKAPVSKPWADVVGKPCKAHEKGIALPPELSGSFLCLLVKKRYEQAFADGGRACLEIAAPETFGKDFDGKVDLFDVTGLENLIRTAIRPLYEVSDYPKPMRDGAFLERARQIILRVRHDTLLKNADAQIKRYDGVLADVQQSGGCYSFPKSSAPDFTKAVNKLRAEVVAAKKTLAAVYNAGAAQAKKDIAAVAAAGRTRPQLAFPALTDDDRQWLSMVLGGIYWRIRGRGLYEKPMGGSTQLARLYFNAMPMQAIGELNGGAEGKQAGLNVHLHIYKGWGEWFDMGHNTAQDDRYHDLAFMTERGQYQIELARDQLKKAGYDATDLEIGGMMMGPCYYYVWFHLAKIKFGLDLTDPFVHFIDSPTSWGELCAGATISLGLARTLLKGTPVAP